MKQNPFNVGDRVVGYDSTSPLARGKIETVIGNLVYIIEDGFFSCHSMSPFHWKQCRRIKPKKPLREVWVNEYPDGRACFASKTKEEADAYSNGRIGVVRFREVMEKK